MTRRLTRARTAAQARLRGGRGADEGYSLVELLIAMMIFTFVLAVFMQGVVLMTKDTVRVQAVGSSADSMRKAFDRFDKEIRYASLLDRPKLVGGTFYMDFLTSARLDGAGSATCTGYKLDTSTDQLSRRQWNYGATPPTTWTVIATNIVNTTSEAPFTFTAADAAGFAKQQMRIYLRSRGGSAATELKAVFVARNSTPETTTNVATNPNQCVPTGVYT